MQWCRARALTGFTCVNAPMACVENTRLRFVCGINFTAIGLLLMIVGDLGKLGPGGYPLSDVLILAAHDVVAWTFAGLVVAWRIKPEPSSMMGS
jgi:hypothetical protein